MNALTELKESLKGRLEAEEAVVAHPILAGVTVTTVYPERIIAPAIIIHPGDPYVTDDEATFGAYNVNLLASLITSTGSNDAVGDELDDMIAAVIAVLDVASVTDPFPFQWADTKYLAANAALAKQAITLGD